MNGNASRIHSLFSKHAADYRERFWDVTRYAASLRYFVDRLPPSARLLEVGCGPGNVTSFLLEARPDLSILATDFSTEMMAIAARENPTAQTRMLDATDILSAGSDFDGIVCSFLFPYLDAEQRNRFVADAAQILRPGGVLYISTMIENESQRSGVKVNSHGDEVYMYYHSMADIHAALVSAGFFIPFAESLSYAAADATTTTDLMLVARKG